MKRNRGLEFGERLELLGETGNREKERREEQTEISERDGQKKVEDQREGQTDREIPRQNWTHETEKYF